MDEAPSMPSMPEQSSGNEIVAPSSNTFKSLKSIFKDTYSKKCKNCGKTYKPKMNK